MAKEPKTNTDTTPSSPHPAGQSDSTNISPAPMDVHEKPGEDQAAPQAGDARITAEPLPDGTVPTVITTGESHRSVAKSKASISSIYRKADILTTVLTFGGVLLAIVVIAGAYFYFTSRNQTTTPAPKVTTLNQEELSKLGAFFEGNSAGTSSEVLTISASTLFKNRIATNSDLKVIGGAEVTGPTVLGDLTVDKTSTLGIANIRGQLTVAGPLSVKGTALLGAGASVNGNFSVTGTGSFGGAVSASTLNVKDVSVTGTLNLAGHLSIGGQNPSVSPGSEAGAGASTSVEGNDAAGTFTINTGNVAPQLPPVGGLLGKLTFRSAYPRTPKVIISPIGQNGAALQYYVLKTSTGFIIGSNTMPASNTSYSFDYWVVQ